METTTPLKRTINTLLCAFQSHWRYNIPLLCTTGSTLAVVKRPLLAGTLEPAALRAPVANVFKLFIMADRREMVTWLNLSLKCWKLGLLQTLQSLGKHTVTTPIAFSMTSISSSFQQASFFEVWKPSCYSCLWSSLHYIWCTLQRSHSNCMRCY